MMLSPTSRHVSPGPINWTTKSRSFPIQTTLTIGLSSATGRMTKTSRPITFLLKQLDIRTWMLTASGTTWMAMGRCGHRPGSPRIGRRIAMDTGSGLLRGDGPGWKMNRGDSLLSITDGGLMCRVPGAGCQDRLQCGLFILRHWLRSWEGTDSVFQWAWAAALAWDGSRWLLAKSMFRGIAPAACM